ncbi:acyl-CoA dehydrogenase family protein [Halomarina salina]|uniref:Acyl-CoA dehydrogenase family protein n=1 Tax=Halomarina salina TaxID=1872699 RepID=A0ABD5RM52_9EURY|nr:acyl-CoA dehydrogenase family protein [Halomarina salina]
MQLTADQQAFREDLRGYLQEEVEPVVDELDANGPLDRDELMGFIRDLRDLGIGFDPETAPEFFGDVWRFMLTAEEISRVWPSLNVGLLMSFPSVFVRFAAEETREAMLPKLETGECLGSLAVTEPSGGSDTARPRTTARKEGDEFVINGQKTWVGNAHYADVVMVVAEDEEAGAQDMFLVDRENSSFETEELDKMGWKGVSNARITFDEVRIPEGNRFSTMFSNAIAEGHDMNDVVPFPESVTQLFFEQKPLNATFSFMRTGMSFMSVGIMQAAFDEALDHATDRETFGKPIGQHQLVQEKLYDMRMGLETSRQLSRRAAEALEAGSEDARLLSSMAKGYTSETAVDVTSDAIQVFGGEGLKTENRLERYFRDARVMPIPDGTTEIQKLVVGKELTDMSAYS